MIVKSVGRIINFVVVHGKECRECGKLNHFKIGCKNKKMYKTSVMQERCDDDEYHANDEFTVNEISKKVCHVNKKVGLKKLKLEMCGWNLN